MAGIYSTSCPVTGNLCTHRYDLVEAVELSDATLPAIEDRIVNDPDQSTYWASIRDQAISIRNTSDTALQKGVSCDSLFCGTEETAQSVAIARHVIADTLTIDLGSGDCNHEES